MGEAVYYMRARWPSEEEAKKALPFVRDFLEEMRKAEDRWHEIQIEEPHESYEILKNTFPRVFKALHIQEPKEEDKRDWSGLNFLAGVLNSPSDEFGKDPFIQGDEIRFHGLVWHFADWGPLAEAMKVTFGAVEAGWVSDEGVDDYYSLVKMS